MTDPTPTAALLKVLTREGARSAALEGQAKAHAPGFAAFLTARDRPAGPQAADRWYELALAFLCLEGNAQAVDTLQREYLAPVAEQLARTGFPADVAEETKARLSERLLLPVDGATPGLASYSGKASLASWLKVVATREAMKVQQEAKPTDTLDDEVIDSKPGEEDPELLLFKTRFREQFARAFRESLEELPAHERLVLRRYFIEELTIDQLAQLHGVHRATTARWVAHARAVLVDKVKRQLQTKLKLEEPEVTKLVRAVRTGFDLSLRRYM